MIKKCPVKLVPHYLFPAINILLREVILVDWCREGITPLSYYWHFVSGIHQSPMDSPHIRPVMCKPSPINPSISSDSAAGLCVCNDVWLRRMACVLALNDGRPTREFLSNVYSKNTGENQAWCTHWDFGLLFIVSDPLCTDYLFESMA